MQEKLKNLPNSITVMRMVGTVSLLFTKPMSLLILVQNLTVLQTFCFIL